MPENIAKDRRDRIEKNNDSSTLITEETEGGNIYEKQIFDIMEYIEMSSKSGKDSDIAQKILKLKEYGITDEQIISEYKKNASTMENENTISANLDLVFKGLVNFINQIPNGVIIDLATARKNEDASFEQAIQYGIYPEDLVVENLNKTIIDGLGNYFGDKENENDNLVGANVMQLIDSSDWESLRNNDFSIELNNDIEDFLNKNEDDMNISDPLKNISRESKMVIENSPYEVDMHLFEISKLQVMLKAAENTQEYNIILGKISDFYKKHPTYVSKELPVLNQDGSLNKNEIIKMEEYSQAYQKMIILEHIDSFNSMTPEQLKDIDSKEKKHMVMCAFAGMAYRVVGNSDEREMSNECSKIIKQLYHGIDLEDEKALAEVFNENSVFNTNFENLTLKEIINIYSRQLKESTENYIERDMESYRGKEINFDKLDLDSSDRRVFDSAMQNYFIGSNINFTKDEEDMYQLMYQDYTIDSWIQSKDEAIRLRYMALMHMQEEYKLMPPSDYIDGKMEKLEEDIERFEKKFGKMSMTPGEKEGFEIYKHNFINAGLTKYLTRDVLEWQKGDNYSTLDDDHKKGYIRNILVALEDSDVSNTCVHKLALRRLELMGANFITFDENGEYHINKELILHEYNKLSEHTYADFEELNESAMLRKNKYLLAKLEEYTNLDEKAFLKLDDNCDRSISMEQIEERRRESNQRKIEKIGINWRKNLREKELEKQKELRLKEDLKRVKKNSKAIIEKSPYESDRLLYVISKLQIELRETNNPQEYNAIQSKINEFYTQNPSYKEREIPVINEDGSLNKHEVAKINEYSEAYQKLVMLERFDSFNSKSSKDIDNMGAKEKSHIIMCAFAGLKYQKGAKGVDSAIAKQATKIIKQIYPDIDLNHGPDLEKVLRKITRTSEHIENLTLNDLISIASKQLGKATERNLEEYRLNDSTKAKIADLNLDEVFQNAEELNTSAIGASTKNETTRDETSMDQQTLATNSSNSSEITASRRTLSVSEMVVAEGERTNEEKKPIFERMKNAFKKAKNIISKVLKGEEIKALGPGEGNDEGASDTSTDSGKKDNNAKANGNFVPTSATPVPTFVGDEGKSNKTQNHRGTSAEDKDVGLDL